MEEPDLDLECLKLRLIDIDVHLFLMSLDAWTTLKFSIYNLISLMLTWYSCCVQVNNYLSFLNTGTSSEYICQCAMWYEVLWCKYSFFYHVIIFVQCISFTFLCSACLVIIFTCLFLKWICYIIIFINCIQLCGLWWNFHFI